MAKSKVYGFSPWVDQVDAINQIMKDTGERNESAVLRKLVDEALDARRKKSQSAPLTEESDHAGVQLKTIESLLMRLARQGHISLRIEDVCLALLQDVLAEAYATRQLLWESLVLPQLRAEGVDVNELERQFVLQKTEPETMPMVKLNESSSHRKLRNEIVRPSPKHLASAANAVDSNAVQRKGEIADRASQTLSLTGSKCPES